jgi:hypothetical protein
LEARSLARVAVQDDQLGTGPQQRVDQFGTGFDEMLAVVQDEQRPPRAEGARASRATLGTTGAIVKLRTNVL